MRRIELETGDFQNHKRLKFVLTIEDDIIMGFEPYALVQFPKEDWRLFGKQLDHAFEPGSVHAKGWWNQFWSSFFDAGWGKHRINNLKTYPDAPLGSPGMKDVINEATKCTPAYQLFLAAIDIAAKFLFEESVECLSARSLLFEGRVLTSFRDGGGSVFILPDKCNGVVTLGNDEKVIGELLDNNKLCKLTFKINRNIPLSGGSVVVQDERIRYYIPYCTPLTQEFSKEAYHLWNYIRDIYYQIRYYS